MTVHIQGIELQAATIVEGHVAADPIKRLSRCDYRRVPSGSGAEQPLH